MSLVSSEKFCYAKISLDTHSSNSTTTQALYELYPDLDERNLIGASLYINVQDGYVNITLVSLDKYSDKALALLYTMLSKPKFSKSELQRAKDSSIADIKTYKEEARELARDQFRNALFSHKDRRHSADPDELIKTVRDVTQAEVRAFHKLVLNSFWNVTVAGTSKINSNLQTTIERLKKTSKTVTGKKIHSLSSDHPGILLKSVPSKTNIEFSIAQTLPITLHHPDYHAFIFGLAVLGKWGGFTGRLMSTVREKEGLTYSIYARPETMTGTEAGYWRIMTFFSPLQAKQGLNSTLREIKKIKKEGITKKEYEMFKVILNTQETLKNDSVRRQLDDLHLFHTLGFSLEEMTLFKSKLLSVTKKDVDKALNKYIDLKQVIISGVGPVDKVTKELKTVIT